MLKFVDTAKKITSTVMLITGIVLALGAALKAFSETMQQYYPNENKNGGNENE